ncbi:hypothetical protein NIES2101_23405 [Calothrix sp. HK-06]|nr:hypothetical protein NIES2101_23405 [Calothrix sp. HK-06]
MQYPQTLRWLNQMKDKLDSSGNLNEAYIAWCRNNGWSETGIEKERLKFQAKYQELKKLDEESPEVWHNYTPLEAIFTPEQREMLNPDGSVRADYLEKIAGDERRINEVMIISAEKVEAIEEFYNLVEHHRLQGINHAAYAKDNFDEQNRNALRPIKESELADLRNFEEISSLSFSIEPNEYQSTTQALSQFNVNPLDTEVS